MWRGSFQRNHGNRGTGLAVRVQIKGSKRIAQGNKENPTHIFHWAKLGLRCLNTRAVSDSQAESGGGGGGCLHRDACCLGVVVRLASRQMTATAFMSSIRASVSRGISTPRCVLSSAWALFCHVGLTSLSFHPHLDGGYLSGAGQKRAEEKVSARQGSTPYLGSVDRLLEIHKYWHKGAVVFPT